MLQRGSEFQKQLHEKEKNKGKECKKIFEVVYWLAKEELPNRKLSSVLEMIKKIAGVDLKRQFPYSSKGIERELFLTLAQVFKEKIKEKIGNGVYGILTDEVTDISLTQQLVTFIQYYDSQSCTTTTSFLAISNTLKGNNVADAPQIKKVLLEQLQSVGLEVQTMRSFVSDGASFMTGARNRVAKLLKDENPLILSFHCLAHKLALACASSADTLDYIAHCELQLNQLWKLFENSAKHTAMYLKVQESTKNLTLNSAGRKQVAKKLKRACRRCWLSLDKSVEAVFTDFCAIIETLEQLKTEPTGSAADGLLKRMKKVKFIGTIYILHNVLPVLSQLDRNLSPCCGLKWCHLESVPAKPKHRLFLSIRLRYYHNSDASFQLECLLSCGDIGSNPGPTNDEVNRSNRSSNSSNSTCGNLPFPFNAKGLRCCHLNVRSLPPHFDEVTTLIRLNKLDIFAISETWLNSTWNDHELNIDDYCHF